MKLLVTILLTILAIRAYGSCEELSGNYLCRAGSKAISKSLLIVGNQVEMITEGVESTLILDGETYSVPATSSMKDGKVSALCVGEKMVVNFSATLLYEGEELAKQTQKTEYVKSNEGLEITVSTKAKGIPLPKLKYLCQRV